MKRLLLVAVVLLLALAAVAGIALRQPLQVPGGDAALLVTVEPGDTLGKVLRRLQAAGNLGYLPVLRAYARLHPRAARTHTGEYEIAAGTPAWQVIEQLLSGRTLQRSLTLVEGWNFRQFRAALARQDKLRQQTAGMDDAAVMAALGRPGLHPEGRFAPDTYFYAPPGSSDLDILRRALDAQDARLAEAWEGRDAGLPYRNADELLAMASIVEKETGQAAERAQIAGVFVRRLRIGMRLQTDPTVIYGLGDSYRGNITRAHLLAPTPYNTYTIDGLPPTPIAMPGREALLAAAHPAPGNALYFVARGDGSHRFSATLQEHNAAVREYQLRRRADYRSAPAAEAP